MFSPDNELTEKQAVLMVLRALNLIDKDSDALWEETAIDEGFISHGKDVNRIITREEFAKILTKALIYKTGDIRVTVGMDMFKDSSEISEEFKMDVLAVSKTELMKGDENGCFNPKKSLTRAEAATTIARLIYK